ncbi:MAG: HEAT repeat protein [Planctomycetota bacterium]|jgi:HEAT repeat protein
MLRSLPVLPSFHRRSGVAPMAIVLRLVVLAGVLFWGWKSSTSGGAEKRELTLSERYLEDDRIKKLMWDCQVGLAFEGDTTDLTEVMVAKLAKGQRDVLHRYQAFLASQEAKVVPALTLLFEDHYGDRFGGPVLQNVLNVCALMETNAGIEIGRSGFGHPKQEMRLTSLDVIRRHGDPSDYDAVAGWIPKVMMESAVLDFLKALNHCDPDRFANDVADWMESGQYRPAWFHMSPMLSHVKDEALARRFLTLAKSEDTPQPARAGLLAPMAGLGDQEAQDMLVARMASEVDQRVLLAMAAAQSVGMHNLVQPALIHDKRAGVRERAARILGEGEGSEWVTAWLIEGLSDSERMVRDACLAGLLIRKDPAAIARVLLKLSKSDTERDSAFAVLNGNWDADPELPQRALDVLMAEFEARPAGDARVSILKVVGRVPLRAAADFLLDHEGDLPAKVGGLTPHRWVCGHAFNAGPGGMEALYARLVTETDPIRRLDLIGMIWQDKSVASTEILLEVLTNSNRSDYERLYAADRLTRIADPRVLAPITKRFYFECTDRYVRPALQCLLWTWFGLPNA